MNATNATGWSPCQLHICFQGTNRPAHGRYWCSGPKRTNTSLSTIEYAQSHSQGLQSDVWCLILSIWSAQMLRATHVWFWRYVAEVINVSGLQSDPECPHLTHCFGWLLRSYYFLFPRWPQDKRCQRDKPKFAENNVEICRNLGSMEGNIYVKYWLQNIESSWFASCWGVHHLSPAARRAQELANSASLAQAIGICPVGSSRGQWKSLVQLLRIELQLVRNQRMLSYQIIWPCNFPLTFLLA